MAATAGWMAIFAIGVWCGYWALRYTGEKFYATAAVDAALAVAAVSCAVAVMVAQLGWVRPRCETTGGQTVLRPNPIIMQLLVVAMLTCFPASLAVAILLPQDLLAWTLTRREFGKMEFGAILLAAATGAGLIAMAISATKHRARSIRLSPNCIEFTEWKSSATAWSDLTEVVAGSAKGCPIVLVAKDGKNKLFSSAPHYTPRGYALYWMLRHYWKHPEDRPELADGRALERLRDEQFDTT